VLAPATPAPGSAARDLPPLRPAAPPAPAARAEAGAAPTGGVSAEDFRHLVSDYAHLREQQAYEARRAEALERRARTKDLIDHHIAEEAWQRLMHQAREAAEHGAKEFLLLRFPNELCTDNGRAINAAEPDWPASLRGEAAEVYLRWKNDLRSKG